MHSPEPGEKYTVSLEEFAKAFKGQVFNVQTKDMPASRRALITGKVRDGELEVMIVGRT